MDPISNLETKITANKRYKKITPFNILPLEDVGSAWVERGVGVLLYISYMAMCCWEGYGFQVV